MDRAKTLKKLFECSHYFILNVSTKKWVEPEFKEGQSSRLIAGNSLLSHPFKI
jgi:hypothetical protein